MISFYILCKRSFLKRKKGLSDARVVKKKKKEYGFFGTLFINLHKVLNINI